MTDDELLAILRSELDVAQGFDADVLADKRAKALDYYFGTMPAGAVGGSQIVSHDVADTVHALMAQTTDIFRASQVEFSAINADDEDQAQLESDVIKTILENNDEYKTFDSSTFDALLQGNGWIKVDIEESQEIIRQRFDRITDVEAMAAIDNLGQDVEIELTDEENHDDGTSSFNLKGTITTRDLTVKSISPDVMLFSPGEDQYNLQELRLVAERKLFTVTELIDLGLTRDEAETIPDFRDDYWPAIIARDSRYFDNENELGGQQPATRLKETFICYWLVDLDDSGIAERRKIHYGGSVIIENEPAAWIPYVTGSPLPVPHRIQGQGMFEQMDQIQESKTGILRSYMDNLSVMNQSRVGYLKGEVDVEDLLDGRINGAVGMDRPDAIFPFPSNDIGMTAIQGLQYLDTVRTSRGGAALDLSKAEMQIASSSATAASMEYSAKEKMAGLYCTNLAQTILKHTFLLVHKTMRELMPGQIDAKINGKWVQTDPSEWPERKHAIVNVGMTHTQRMAKVQGLNQLMVQLESWIQQGLEGILTDKGKVYNAAADWIRASEIGANPEEYLTDPNSQEAQQVAQQQGEQAEQDQAQQQQQSEQMIALQVEMEKQKDATERWIADMELKFKYYDANLKAELKEAELTTDLTKEIIDNDND